MQDPKFVDSADKIQSILYYAMFILDVLNTPLRTGKFADFFPLSSSARIVMNSSAVSQSAPVSKPKKCTKKAVAAGASIDQGAKFTEKTTIMTKQKRITKPSPKNCRKESQLISTPSLIEQAAL